MVKLNPSLTLLLMPFLWSKPNLGPSKTETPWRKVSPNSCNKTKAKTSKSKLSQRSFAMWDQSWSLQTETGTVPGIFSELQWERKNSTKSLIPTFRSPTLTSTLRFSCLPSKKVSIFWDACNFRMWHLINLSRDFMTYILTRRYQTSMFIWLFTICLPMKSELSLCCSKEAGVEMAF